MTMSAIVPDAADDVRCMLADIIFVVDSSGSIQAHNWLLVLEFLQSMVDDFQLGAHTVRVSEELNR